MFTEGLDETAINWIKKGTELESGNQKPTVRSPLAERTAPRSPLCFNGIGNGSYSPASNSLPPLKFHSGLLSVPRSLVGDKEDDEDDDDDMSVVDSVSDSTDSYDEGEPFGSSIQSSLRPVESCYGDEEEPFGCKDPTLGVMTRGNVSSLNRGFLSESLRVEVPESNFRRYTDTELGLKKSLTPGSCNQLQKQIHLRHFQGPMSKESGVLRDSADLGTPSAPPMFEVPNEEGQVDAEYQETSEDHEFVVDAEHSENETRPSMDSAGLGNWKSDLLRTVELGDRVNTNLTTSKEKQMGNSQANQSDLCYSTSGQYAWQTMIAYDACIRLCLQAWESGCVEAPAFLHGQCMILRNAFGLQNYLLQPRALQAEERPSMNTEQKCPLNAKQVVGKIRVEVKKLRVISRRKLKSTYSQRGAIYMQVGAEYVKNVVKTSMHSLKSGSLAITVEEPQTCLFQMNSATENNQIEPASAICLRPGSADYHVFFPETQGDSLLVEAQDSKRSVLGRAMIPISSLTDNPNDRLRWWPLYHDDQECTGKIQLYIGSTVTHDETNHVKSGQVAETLAYDLLLEAAMRAQNFHSRNLWLQGQWKWLLSEFSEYYAVSISYTQLRYLSHVMHVATPTKDCLELVYELLVPITEARSQKGLTRQEKSILLDCETQIERLLASTFENYKSLDEESSKLCIKTWDKSSHEKSSLKSILLDCETQIERLLASTFENYKSLDEESPSGIRDIFGPIQEVAAPALGPAVKVYCLLHDILSPDGQTMLRSYLKTAARKRCRTHMVETEEFMSSNSEGLNMDIITISTAYLKMKNLCTNIGNEIQADIKIHDLDILPSSIDLSNITASVYSTELSTRLRVFLATWPPSSPQPHVNELLVAAADFERNLESWHISPVQGGVDSRNLFHDYIMVWVQDMQLGFLDHCKSEKVPWSGVSTNHSTSPFAEDMYEKMRGSLVQYEIVINRWPHYSLVLESAVADVERTIIKALERQYSDILTPLKDSIPKRLNMQVQKLTRRQSMAIYYVPSQLGTFLNTMKRILDVLHCRVEDILKAWASVLPVTGDKKSLFGEQMNAVTVLLRTKYKNYLQAVVSKLVTNLQANRNTVLKRILEETREKDGECEVRERMRMLSSQLVDSISNLHEVFTSQIFIATCRGFWDRMGQIVLKFLEGRKENRVWYNGSYYALGILDDTFASQMQRLQGNSLKDRDLELPRSVVEARSILSRDTSNTTETYV